MIVACTYDIENLVASLTDEKGYIYITKGKRDEAELFNPKYVLTAVCCYG
jgi:hypothetical protein